VPTSLLQLLNDCLLALLLLFLLRVLRAVWVQLRPAPPVAAAAPAPRPAKAKAAPLRLRVVDSAVEPGRIFEVGDEVTLGRAPGCGVSLSDTTVSQVHARLFRRGSQLWIEDLGSTNGTWVNKTRVSAPTPLKRGDRLAVGTTVIEVTR
jgi:pSer/pThr/pTyr-binding forkhead associated (FHA) protein